MTGVGVVGEGLAGAVLDHVHSIFVHDQRPRTPRQVALRDGARLTDFLPCLENQTGRRTMRGGPVEVFWESRVKRKSWNPENGVLYSVAVVWGKPCHVG